MTIQKNDGRAGLVVTRAIPEGLKKKNVQWIHILLLNTQFL